MDKKETQDPSFQFFYDEVGEKEIMDQLVDSYQSGYEYTVTQEHDPQHQKK
ncbi:hypothetical protein [Bacillus sp. AK128]